jgi:8-oxo-dGTP diphosphatase
MTTKPIKGPQVSILLDDGKGRVLFQLRDGKPKLYPHHWSTFGGSIEPGETPLNAAVREIKEELDYDLVSPEYVGVYNFDGYDIHVFRKIDTSLRVETLTIYEGAGAAFLSLTEAQEKPFAFHLDRIIVDYFGKYYPENHVSKQKYITR